MADCDRFPRAHTMREVTVAPSIVADMAHYLRTSGADADAICRRAGIEPGALATRTARVSGRAMATFWREAITALDDHDLGMHATVAANPGALDIVGYVMLSSKTADEALARAARLIRLLNDGLALTISRERLGTRCRLTVLATNDAMLRDEPRQVVETILLGIVHQLRLLTQRPVVPMSLSMRHSRPPSGATEHERLFGRMPLFDSKFDEVVIANPDLDVPLRSANAVLLAAFDAHADAAVAALGARDTVTLRASVEIVAALKGETPTIGVVASALAMSGRTLQRHLSAEGTSFQALLDSLRRELAIRHLADPNATVAKVAWLVGFSEAGAFHRSFRRWTGQSPRAAVGARN